MATASIFEIEKGYGDLDHVKYLLMFVGYSRSGTSILRNLLDAHPNMIVAHEYDILSSLGNPGTLSRQRLFCELIANSRQRLRRELQVNNPGASLEFFRDNPADGYIPGESDNLLVIGDKKAEYTSEQTLRSPELLAQVQRIIGKIQIKFLHVVRNPYDTVSAFSHYNHFSLSRGIDKYVRLNDGARTAKKWSPEHHWLTVHHEGMIESPGDTLRAICRWLELPAPLQYAKACQQRLFRKPNERRLLTNDWTDTLRKRVKTTLIDRYEYLAHYSFESICKKK